ncbi:MAG: RNA polymerase subunit sigma [Gloeobacteraceae cyanobacterium ES-bin-316]|nr:RNA polymerase subunit sigma [Ferruginibacter sp.]
MQEQELIPHLFRTEFRKIVSVLSKLFGLQHIEIAEDITSETFLLATETWGKKGLPENPTAWLYTVAKNKTKDYLKRNQLFTEKIAVDLKYAVAGFSEMEIDLSLKNISDSQLQMMFAICHPIIPEEAQIGLSLRILCGFGIDEIADAFLSNKETINKRLFRAKEKLRVEKVSMEFPSPAELENRLDAVLKTLYLLFNEGYYSASQNISLRKDLCLEALRLAFLLTENKNTNSASVNALLALMCFHASRFEARLGDAGEIILYEDQDRSLWNKELVEKGEAYLAKAAIGNKLTKFHLEAAIAYWHTQPDNSKSKWQKILQLYNLLLQIEYSPMTALNRTFALAKADSYEKAISEALKLRLENNHLYFALLGELYNSVDKVSAKKYFSQAISLARTERDKNLLSKKLLNLNDKNTRNGYMLQPGKKKLHTDQF